MSEIRNEHAPCAPSSSELWLNCGGAYALEKWAIEHGHIPEDDSSYHADRGTAAHELSNHQVAQVLRDDGRLAGPIPRVPMTLDARTLPDVQHNHLLGPDDFTAVNVLIDWLEMQQTFFGGQMVMEQRVRWSDQVWGSMDYAFIRPDKLVVADYKNGFIYVHENSPQFRIYGASKAKDLGMTGGDPVETFVIQPKPFGKQPIRSCTYQAGDLLSWMENTVQPWAERIVSGEELPREPGETQCRWCRVKGLCPELHAWSEQQKAKAARSPGAVALTPAQVAEALNTKPLLDIYHEGLAKQALSWCLNGMEVPGYKAVRATTHRRYSKSEQEAMKLAGSLTTKDGKKVFKKADYVTTKILTPKQLMDKLKGVDLSDRSQKKVKELVIKPEGGPVLALEDDTRPQVGPTAISELFSPVDQTAAPQDPFKLTPPAAGAKQTKLPL